MMTLEMLYIMNVILYIDISIASIIPFINKKCKNACKAMKINPWDSSFHSLNDIQIVLNIFSGLQTFRVDYKTLLKHKEHPIFQTIENIELIKQSNFPESKHYPKFIRDKAHVAFSFNQINLSTRVVRLKNYSVYSLQKIQSNKTIKTLYLTRKYKPSKKEINELNNCSRSIKIILVLSKKSFLQFSDDRIELTRKIIVTINTHNNLYIVPHELASDVVLSPFSSNQNTLIFDKYFLPTKILLRNNEINFSDLTLFQYVKDITISPVGNTPKAYIKLPISIENIEVVEKKLNYDHTEIINWGDLINLKKINDHNQIYVPYPQIKQKITSPETHKTVSTLCKIYCALNMLTVLYFIISVCYHGITIIYSLFDFDVIYYSSFQHFFGYIHFFIFDLVLDYCRTDGKKNFLFTLTCLSSLWYPYSLLYYHSTFMLYIFTLLTFPTIILHIQDSILPLNYSRFDINKYLTILFHGHWFSIIKENELFGGYGEFVSELAVITMTILLFVYPIGIVISLIHLQGYLVYITLLSLVGVLVFMVLVCLS